MRKLLKAIFVSYQGVASVFLVASSLNCTAQHFDCWSSESRILSFDSVGQTLMVPADHFWVITSKTCDNGSDPPVLIDSETEVALSSADLKFVKRKMQLAQSPSVPCRFKVTQCSDSAKSTDLIQD